MSQRTDTVMKGLIAISKERNLPLDIIARNAEYPFKLTAKECVKVGMAVYKLTIETTLFTPAKLAQDIYEQAGGVFNCIEMESSYDWVPTVFENRESFLAVVKIVDGRYLIGYPIFLKKGGVMTLEELDQKIQGKPLWKKVLIYTAYSIFVIFFGYYTGRAIRKIFTKGE